MTFVSAASPFDPYTDEWTSEGRPRLGEQFFKVGHFLHGLRVRMRFGEISRAPLRLLRLNLLGEVVKCDWLARAPDPWDKDLSQSIGERHASLQTLRTCPKTK
jgi:hypothetical protein